MEQFVGAMYRSNCICQINTHIYIYIYTYISHHISSQPYHLLLTYHVFAFGVEYSNFQLDTAPLRSAFGMVLKEKMKDGWKWNWLADRAPIYMYIYIILQYNVIHYIM